MISEEDNNMFKVIMKTIIKIIKFFVEIIVISSIILGIGIFFIEFFNLSPITSNNKEIVNKVSSNNSETNTSSDKKNTMQSAKITQLYYCLGIMYAGAEFMNDENTKDSINIAITRIKRKYRKEFDRDELNKYMEKAVIDTMVYLKRDELDRVTKITEECTDAFVNSGLANHK